MNKTHLESAMLDVLEKIEQEMTVLEAKAAEMGIDVTLLRSPTGDYMVIPLLVARANVLSSMAFLAEREVVKPPAELYDQTQGRVILVTEDNQMWAAQACRLSLWEVQERYKKSVRDGAVCVIPIPTNREARA